jgi:hypothetical protein
MSLDSTSIKPHSVPEWWLALYREIKGKHYTGPVQLDCREGEIVKITHSQTRRVSEFKSICDND